MKHLYSKLCLKRSLKKKKKKTKISFQDRLSFNAGQKYCRMPPLLPFVVFFVNFEWPLKTDFTVQDKWQRLMGNSGFIDKVQDIIHKAGKAFIVKSEVRKINQLISRKSNLNSIIQNLKAA